ncbi:hypothetical protein [Thalassospira xiamenensis]|uniref:hypothetical protein n=1 Tax=Thalassospira xiamenensis TaxID=220697 RepID=UPI003AA8CE7A
METCPVCRNEEGGSCRTMRHDGSDQRTFRCDVCGTFSVDRRLLSSQLNPENLELTKIQRASLSHFIRSNQTPDNYPLLMSDWFRAFVSQAKLPNPAIQAQNIIRFVGNQLLNSGSKVRNLPTNFHAIVGSPSREFSVELVSELTKQGLITGRVSTSISGYDVLNVGLTLAGWECYETEQKGQFSGKYGFIAMKFGDPNLDPFVDNVLKPLIKDAISYDLVDLRNVARAGIIDNIMRAQIRDAAFVLVDLTHDNYGAYWEAGYAEGLGKPVIYLCEKKKFEEAKTHFDTNHCTTVCWTLEEDTASFGSEIIATIRRSLNLFPE